MSQPLTGRAAIITGANQGLGLAIVKAYVAAGASVLMCARGQALLDEARETVAATAGAGQKVEAVRADVSSPSDVDALAARAFALFPQVHVLVNNAGVYGPMGASETVDWDAWVRAMEINVYGSVLPCRALVPHFKGHRYGKIVQVSGGGATNPLPHISSYAASKAAIVRYMESLALEVTPFNIDVNAIAPGLLKTRLLDEVLAAGPDAVGREFHERMTRANAEGGTPLERGAALAVYLGSAESDGITGRLLSAVWDPWDKLASRRAQLEGSDIYTLRRIVPKDRGLEWDEP
jgi:NAD(P)-dependent dehydrogenase (short-subunit alcohol dehydrogenase family)